MDHGNMPPPPLPMRQPTPPPRHMMVGDGAEVCAMHCAKHSHKGGGGTPLALRREDSC